MYNTFVAGSFLSTYKYVQIPKQVKSQTHSRDDNNKFLSNTSLSHCLSVSFSLYYKPFEGIVYMFSYTPFIIDFFDPFESGLSSTIISSFQGQKSDLLIAKDRG